MTSATDRLRALLDERGVEWSATVGASGTMWTHWDAFNGHRVHAMDNEDGTVEIFGEWDVTPEQAVEATLGRGTCQQEEHGWSTEGDHARVWLTCGHDCMVETVADLPNFCPTCGAKVMDA